MANAGDEGGGKPPISLSGISILESSTHWIKWNREVKDYLTMTGYGDMFVQYETPPTPFKVLLLLNFGKQKRKLGSQNKNARVQ